MISLGVKTCGESEFDIFEAKKRFPDSEKACVLKRKVAKNSFLRLFLKYTGHLWVGEAFFRFGNVKFGFFRKGHFQKKILKIFSRGWLSPIV
jgi:hypothetical protein